MNKLRWGKFYWSDWSDDPALAACSLAAQGLWMRLLCIAAQGDPYGHVIIAGKPPSLSTLAKLTRCKVATVGRLIEELERRGVAKRGACGCLVSSRMVADGKLAAIRADAANARWHRESADDFAMQNHPESQKRESEADSNTPPTPRKRGERGARGVNGGGRKESRNGFADSAAADMQETIDHAEAADAHPSGARVVSIAGRAHRHKHH